MKTFYNWLTLTGHRWTHPGESPYECTACGEPFSGKGIPATANPPWRVALGMQGQGRALLDQSSLIRHRTVHTVETHSKDDECGKVFFDGSSHNQHQKIHSGDKPHECIACRKTFLQKRWLTRHQRVHPGEKHHECSTCGKVFSRKSSMTQHQWCLWKSGFQVPWRCFSQTSSPQWDSARVCSR